MGSYQDCLWGLVVWLLGFYGICRCGCWGGSWLAAVTVALIAVKMVDEGITSMAPRVVADIVAWLAAGWQLWGGGCLIVNSSFPSDFTFL
jgi:hypothetical protein